MGNITVNRLPVPTWNTLRINSARVQVADGFEKTAPVITAPAAVKISEMTAKAVSGLFEEKTSQVPRESVVAGKQPVYLEQRLVTGLGADYTDYLDSHMDSVTLFDVPAGTELAEPVIITLDLKG